MSRLHDEDPTRRRILKAGLAVAGGAVAIGPARAAGGDDPAGSAATEYSAPAKFSPEAVQYQPTPKDWQKCLYCTYFQAPDTCSIVSGTVSKQGWCNHFALLHE
jgi:hypothetical protein